MANDYSVKVYGNRKAEIADGAKVPNRVSISMTVEKAKALAARDKDSIAAFIAAVKAEVNS